MIINGSPDIRVLKIKATFDISGTTPVIHLENLSEGDALGSVSYAWEIKSPTQTIIHEADINNPDVTGLWNNIDVNDPWPRPFGNIEWSGAPYTFQATIKDSQGNVFVGDLQDAAICRPIGNTNSSKNPYGVADVLVQVKCEQARIYFQDTTNASYKGLSGDLISALLKVSFPMDETGFVPAPFSASNFSSILVPITFSGKGYQYYVSEVYDYELSENTFVRIKYTKTDTFGVWCHIDLMPLCCELQKLIDSLQNGTCTNAEDAQRKLMLINPKFNLVIIGMMQPLTGIDVPAVIEEIKTIGGFDCDCCTAPTGVVPNVNAIFEGYNFTVTPLGGDVQGQFVVTGPNIDLRVSDISYIFKICEGSPQQTTAFTVVPSLNGFTKTYCLQVDVSQLAEDILNTIASDTALVNLFNSIVLASFDGNFNLIVDGGCIFSSSSSCDYTFNLNSIPASGSFAILSTVQTNAQTYAVNHAFQTGAASLASLNAKLNSLGIGSWAVTNMGGGIVQLTITSTANITSVIYKNPNAIVADMLKNCTGYVPLTANEVVQNIIDYLCEIDDSQVQTATNYEICYIDPADGVQKTSVVLAGAPLNEFVVELLSRGCQTIDYITALGAVNCTSIMSKFPAPALPVAMQPNDVFLATRAGVCSQINPIEAFLTMLTYGIANADVKAAFCNFVAACAGGLPCASYEYFFAVVNTSSPANGDAEIVVTFSHPEAISHIIRYARIDNTNTPVYTTITGITPGDSPYTIAETPALQNGQYRVCIKPVYADGRACAETCYETAPCTGITSFSASYDGTNINVTYTADPSVPGVRLNLTYPNGGFNNIIYNNGDAIQVTPPPNVFGTFFATMQPVCDLNTGWFGAASAAAALQINPPNNSSVVNSSTLNQFAVSVFTVTPNGNQMINQSIDAGNSSPFYIGDGTYSQLIIQVDQADRNYLSAVLVTDSGVYIGAQGANTYFGFNNVQILNGATITLTDNTSPTGDNYVLSASYNYSIVSVTGTGDPVLDPTGVNGTQTGTQTGMSGSHLVTITSSAGAPNTKLEASVNGVTVDCVAITGNGTYGLNITASAFDTVRIAVNGGPC